MFKRLVKYYNACKSGEQDNVTVIWGTILEQHHRQLQIMLETNDETSFVSYMNSVDSSGATHGMETPLTIKTDGDDYNMLLSKLARKVGSLCFFNPEQPSNTDNFNAKDFQLLKSQVEDRLGFKLEPPACKTYVDGIPLRTFFYAAAAFDIRLMCDGQFPKHILEIGPGLGHMANIAKQLGTKTYSVIDLPTSSILFSWFMSEVFGPNNIWLFGEDQPKDQFIMVYPSTKIAGPEIVSNFYTPCELVFNSDGLPEMPECFQNDYISLIANCLLPSGIFFSINHESDNLGQSRVYDVVSRTHKLKLVSRHPFMMRDGYVQEVYKA